MNAALRTEHRPVPWTDPADPMDRATVEVRAHWDLAHAALAKDDLSRARDCIRAAINSADASDLELTRRLRCGHYAVEIELESIADIDVGPLREILSQAESTATVYLGAYQMARVLELRRDWKKALYYARIALSAADTLEVQAWSAATENLIGNVLVAESRFEEAAGHYLRALDLSTDSQGTSSLELDRAQASDNLAFTLCCLDRDIEARPYLASALRILRRTDGPARLSVELDAGVLHLRQDRPARALAYAKRALARARNLDDQRNVSNALLVLAEAAKRVGDDFALRRAVVELGEMYDAEIASALYQFDVLQLVNLKA